MDSSLATSAAAWALELVARPSVNGTADEAAFAGWLAQRLAALPAFGPERVWRLPVPGDPLGRASVAALLPGSGPDTVVLTGHFDTVRTDDYGDLAPLATRPEALKAALLARLADAPAGSVERRTFEDLAGGSFLPGRGLLDMKTGLAAGLAVIEALAGEPERRGNLLFLAVPDEEANSAGARSAAAALADIAARFGLAFVAAINLDALVDDGDGAAGRCVALGTVGKLLPSAFVVGQAVHAADAARGLNAGALAAALVAAVEWSPDLADRTGDELAAPATLLGLKDNRVAYDVTTPDRVWAYWNLMTHRRSPGELLATLGGLGREAATRCALELGRRAVAAGLRPVLPPEVPVLTFAQLRGEVLAADPAAEERFAALARELAGRGLDIPEQCRLLTEQLWTASRRPGPAIVLGFASMPYLPTELRGAAGQRLEDAVGGAAAAVGAAHGAGITVLRYFPGISDMSFLGQADPAAVPTIAANTPAWGFGIDWPAAGAIAGLPIVNAGPWGRDYHTPFERLHAPYAFKVLPELLLAIVRRLL